MSKNPSEIIDLKPRLHYHDGVAYTPKEASVRQWSLQDAIDGATRAIRDRRSPVKIEICVDSIPMDSDLNKKYLTLLEMNMNISRIVDDTWFKHNQRQHPAPAGNMYQHGARA